MLSSTLKVKRNGRNEAACHGALLHWFWIQERCNDMYAWTWVQKCAILKWHSKLSTLSILTLDISSERGQYWKGSYLNISVSSPLNRASSTGNPTQAGTRYSRAGWETIHTLIHWHLGLISGYVCLWYLVGFVFTWACLNVCITNMVSPRPKM